MNIIMKNVALKTVVDIKKFLEGNTSLDLEIVSREEKYTCIRNTLTHTAYRTLSKKGKGIVKAFLAKITGYEEKQLVR